jgi:hypothetical protein
MVSCPSKIIRRGEVRNSRGNPTIASKAVSMHRLFIESMHRLCTPREMDDVVKACMATAKDSANPQQASCIKLLWDRWSPMIGISQSSTDRNGVTTTVYADATDEDVAEVLAALQKRKRVQSQVK